MFIVQAKDRYPIWKEEGLTHEVTQQERHREKTLKKAILEGLLAEGGMALYFQRKGTL
jgi:hypothetical protein